MTQFMAAPTFRIAARIVNDMTRRDRDSSTPGSPSTPHDMTATRTYELRDDHAGAICAVDGAAVEAPPSPRVLFVDDDARVLRGVERVIGAHCAVTTAASASEALALITAGAHFAVVVSDLSMPEMNGIALLNAVRRASPDSVRILFTGEAQLNDAVRAINEGEVFRVILKPIPGSAVLSAVQAGIRQHRLVTAERTLLRETLQGALHALTEVLAIVQPAAYGRAIRLKRHVSDLAAALGIEPRWEVEVAALLSQVGCVTFPPDLVDRWYHHQQLSPEDQEMVDSLPETTVALIAHVPRLEAVRDIILRQHEPASTSGQPAGARLLAIARDFDALIGQGVPAEPALAIMEGRGSLYDATMLAAFAAIRGNAAPASVIHEMRLSDVRTGMTFAADVHSPRGVLLIARGQRVSASLSERLSQQWSAEYASSITVRVIVP